MTAAAVRRLQAELPGGLTVEAVRRADEAELEEIIKGVGFHRKKAVFLKKTAEMLHEKWEGNVPDSLEDLVALPGIGTKMAKIVLSVGFGKVEGIAADTHVHRIAGRLGWTKGFKISKPADTEKALEAWIPREEWDELNLLLVGFGQQICLPRNPKCSECLAKKWCPKIGVRANKNSKKEKDLV